MEALFNAQADAGAAAGKGKAPPKGGAPAETGALEEGDAEIADEPVNNYLVGDAVE